MVKSSKQIFFRTCSRCFKLYYTKARWGRVCQACNKTPSKRNWECDAKGNLLKLKGVDKKWKNKK